MVVFFNASFARLSHEEPKAGTANRNARIQIARPALLRNPRPARDSRLASARTPSLPHPGLRAPCAKKSVPPPFLYKARSVFNVTVLPAADKFGRLRAGDFSFQKSSLRTRSRSRSICSSVAPNCSIRKSAIESAISPSLEKTALAPASRRETD